MAPCHRFVHLLLVVIAFAANAALAPCGGWQTSAEARMACCAGMTQCAQVDADDCCAAGEQRQHGETFASVTPPIPVQSTVPAHATTAPIAHPFVGVVSRGGRPPGSPPDTHLLLSVFLI